MQDVSENEKLLRQVHGIEMRIVKLLEVGADALESLAYEGSDVDAAKEQFTLHHGDYMSILNEIQIGLRQIFRHLSEAGILTGTASSMGGGGGYGLAPLPYMGSVDGEEKDFELTAEGLDLVIKFLTSGVKKVLGKNIEEMAAGSGISENEMALDL
ncbi:hypothetical protein HDU67_006720 [Dinochytrium kinnereticum]|nr:hypothetical protein HDU67_006720 [Dinochytrium kinnereticum]